MKIWAGIFWGGLALATGLVNVLSALLGVALPTVDLEELAAGWGDGPYGSKGF
jgi:hypothetical protein